MEKIKSIKNQTLIKDNNNQKLVEDVPTEFPLANLHGLPNQLFLSNKLNFINKLNIKLQYLEKNSLLILQGGEEVPRFDTDTVFYHFQQESNFYYLSGVNEPNFYLILDFVSEQISLFMKRPPVGDRSFVFQQIPSLEEVSEQFNLKCYDLNEMYPFIAKRNPKKIFRLKGTNSDSKREIKTADFTPPDKLEYLTNLIDDEPLIYEILADSRTVKTPMEINVLSYIAQKTVDAHINMIKNIAVDKYERDIENVFTGYLRNSFYYRAPSYFPICGSGVHASVLHYNNNNSKLKDGDLVLCDMGFRLAGYCSDITSTVPANGKFSKEQKEIYDIVLLTSRKTMKLVKNGASFPLIHLTAERTILEELQKISILNADISIDDMMAKRVAYYFMPHGIGHYIGLECHDVGGYLSYTPKRIDQLGLKSLRTARYLTDGSVITLEPGIYFIQNLLEKAFKDNNISSFFNQDKIKDYYNFGGVRIEDIVYVRKDDCVNLSANLPRSTDEIEKLMAKS